MDMNTHAYGMHTQAWRAYGHGLMVACMNGLIHNISSYAWVEHATTSQV